MYIFPLAIEGHGEDNSCGSWISISPATESINSVQNGMLLDNTIHALFDLSIKLDV